MSGPTYCDFCGAWPARHMALGKMCHLCESRYWCAMNPVPLPSDPQMRADLALLSILPAQTGDKHVE